MVCVDGLDAGGLELRSTGGLRDGRDGGIRKVKFIPTMKRILVVLSLVGLVTSSALAAECCDSTKKVAAKSGCASACSAKEMTSTCPVTKAKHQARGAAGSTKERARAVKPAMQQIQLASR